MAEWTVRVVTPPETTRDEQALTAFDAVLRADPTIADPAATMHNDDGALAAVFQVEAPNRDEASLVGCFAYWRAIGAAGLELHADSTVEITGAPDDDELLGRYRFKLERD